VSVRKPASGQNDGVQDLARIAFVSEPRTGAAIEVRVNFGIFAGRDVTNAEIEELARIMLPEVPSLSIVAEHRHEVDKDVEVSVHQVRIEIDHEALPDGADPAVFGARVATLAEGWAESCFSDRHADISET
jgi:hypothetical protein